MSWESEGVTPEEKEQLLSCPMSRSEVAAIRDQARYGIGFTGQALVLIVALCNAYLMLDTDMRALEEGYGQVMAQLTEMRDERSDSWDWAA